MRNLISREGKQWMKEGIITEEQYHTIINRYDIEKKSNLLPILASILIGLSILTFIASNWDGIHHIVRVFIIVIGMTSFYVSGGIFHKKGNSTVGDALIGIGVITFGAGIILLGQMFHFQSYDARAFIIWAVASLLVVQLWESKYLLLLSIVIITVGQLYSFLSYSSFSYVLALLLLFGVSHFAYHRSTMATSVSFSISYLIHAILFIIHFELNYQYLFAFALVLYLISNLIKEHAIKTTVKNTALIAAIAVTIFNVFWIDSEIVEERGSILYAIVIALLFVLFYVIRRKSLDLVDGLLFLPLFYIEEIAGVLYLLILFIYSICLLIIGYQNHHTEKATFGTVLFLLSAFVGYIQIAWDFMPKSLFFLLGGIILFILSWFLEKNRRKLVKGEK
ncbi:DUF2157 domain-containing protein [Bacillus suaedaesalsae]|uniref:DUF2157 domain-containing protein n=1 Tax=Bacillus suaedaesalsae TaxID=2810349 RepID=A0ABS2DFA2_9BACI|nr:DUF2157 domain-containing protein [Bacillus suaedaesalsae]MBM6617129.1 DUF2157 domain-containing protein [Bacillus suaedaesalsae]